MDCKVLDNQNLCISSATLAHLTIIYCGDFELYTPSLRNFVYKGYPTVQQLCGSKSNLSSIKHANIEVSIYLLKSGKTSLVLRNWYVELANIESLTISSTAIQILYLAPRILKADIPSFCNLKSLKVKMYQSSLHGKYVDFFRQMALSAKVEFI
ncbi:hypothetical protein QL285_031059 [Trifolium repens]|nr:hypothetical protein QL285_031059 [Trifolium repens]